MEAKKRSTDGDDASSTRESDAATMNQDDETAKIVQFILETPFLDPDVPDNQGKTPIMYARENGRHFMVELLEKHLRARPLPALQQNDANVQWTLTNTTRETDATADAPPSEPGSPMSVDEAEEPTEDSALPS